ncbi:3'-5' exonuclease [Streptomyces sp. NPDC054855]
MSEAVLGHWDDLFQRAVDGRRVEFVRPADTERPVWAVYDRGERYLGTLRIQCADSGPAWHVQSTQERYLNLEDAVRALRRPRAWGAEQEAVTRWARGVLADPELLVFDVQTTGLTSPWAAQIAALDLKGTVLFNELVDPRAAMEHQAVALHGITPELATAAAPFAELLDRLTAIFHARRCVAYPLSFDRGVLERGGTPGPPGAVAAYVHRLVGQKGHGNPLSPVIHSVKRSSSTLCSIG